MWVPIIMEEGVMNQRENKKDLGGVEGEEKKDGNDYISYIIYIIPLYK